MIVYNIFYQAKVESLKKYFLYSMIPKMTVKFFIFMKMWKEIMEVLKKIPIAWPRRTSSVKPIKKSLVRIPTMGLANNWG